MKEDIGGRPPGGIGRPVLDYIFAIASEQRWKGEANVEQINKHL